MIVILNVRTTKKFYRVRYWRAIFVFFSRRRAGSRGLYRCARSSTLDCHRSVVSSVKPQASTCVSNLSSASPGSGGGRDGGSGRRVPASPDTSKTVTFADVVNSTHTGCLSHCTIEGAELSIPRARLSRGFANGYTRSSNCRNAKGNDQRLHIERKEREREGVTGIGALSWSDCRELGRNRVDCTVRWLRYKCT